MKKIDELYKSLSFNSLKNMIIFKHIYPLVPPVASLCTTASAIAKSCSGTPIELETAAFYLGFPLVLYSLESMLPKNVKASDSKEVSQIKEIYHYILKEYNKLHDTFDLDNPIEMLALYIIAYSEGYLSNNHMFSYEDAGFVDLDCLNGVNVINGNAVCRHISAMLKDIYSISGFQNIVLGVSTDLSLNYSNHIINAVTFDERCFYFDPTQIRWYTKQGDSLLSDKQGIIKIQLEKLGEEKNPYSTEYIVNNILSLPSINTNNDLEKYIKAKAEVLKNMDILEKFYNENKEKYAEVADKILVMKKGKSNKRIVDFY